MTDWVRHGTTLGIIFLAMLVALGAIENWQIGNVTAAVAGAGWTVTLVALWMCSERLFELVEAQERDEARDE